MTNEVPALAAPSFVLLQPAIRTRHAESNIKRAPFPSLQPPSCTRCTSLRGLQRATNRSTRKNERPRRFLLTVFPVRPSVVIGKSIPVAAPVTIVHRHTDNAARCVRFIRYLRSLRLAIGTLRASERRKQSGTRDPLETGNHR